MKSEGIVFKDWRRSEEFAYRKLNTVLEGFTYSRFSQWENRSEELDDFHVPDLENSGRPAHRILFQSCLHPARERRPLLDGFLLLQRVLEIHQPRERVSLNGEADRCAQKGLYPTSKLRLRALKSSTLLKSSSRPQRKGNHSRRTQGQEPAVLRRPSLGKDSPIVLDAGTPMEVEAKKIVGERDED